MNFDGKFIKGIRKEMNLNQIEMADKLGFTSQHLSRIENGKTQLSFPDFLNILEMTGRPIEDSLFLLLETTEYNEFKQYKDLKRLLQDGAYTQANIIFEKLKSSGISKKKTFQQFLAFAQVLLEKDISNEDAIKKLQKTLKMTIPEFDETKISNLRLLYNELMILSNIASRLFAIGETQRAITIVQSIVNAKLNHRIFASDLAAALPSLYYNLSNFYGKIDKIEESLEACETALKMCHKANDYRLVPKILLNMATCTQLMGEEEQIWKTYLVRAYHTAYGHGNTAFAKRIAGYAEEDFGITIKYF